VNVMAAGLKTTGEYQTQPQSIKDAAEAFEALFIGQLLKSAREARSSGGLDDSDNSGSPMMELADEHLSQQIAKGGGCGFAKAIMTQLDQSATAQNKHSIGSRFPVE
jgi:flagellar protein FlgJ